MNKFLSWLKRVKMRLNGILDHFKSAKTSYSQNAEDRALLEAFGGKFPEADIYLEVGGNHPTRLSNSYLAYRSGLSGIIIEPNSDFKGLYARFRPRDTFIQIGCAQSPGLLKFHHHSNHVLSGFSDQSEGGKVRSEYLPVFPLDAIESVVGEKRIFMLSIDVEGMDYEVLASGTKLISDKVDSVVIEFGEDEDKIHGLLAGIGFKLFRKTPHNLIYRRG